MREFPIERFWYGKGAAYRSIEELIDKNVTWFIWALEKFQDITPSQAEHFKQTYGIELPDNVICSQKFLDEVNSGKPYCYKKGDAEEVYKNLCRKYADLTHQEWNDWLKA